METIYTIGTQGKNNDLFCKLIKENGIDVVLDIRLWNEGRFYKFASGKNIKSLCDQMGIAYQHNTLFAPSVEMLKKWRNSDQTEKDWLNTVNTYAELIVSRDIFNGFINAVGSFKRPCLLCAEKKPDRCHRRLLAEYMETRLDIPIKHLDKVKEPNYKEYLAAVEKDGWALEYIKEQTPEICLAAVKQYGMALRYVKQQTTELCLAAVKQYGRALMFVNKQTPKICLEAVKQSGRGLKYVKNQTRELCLAAVNQDEYALKYVKDQTPEICLAAIKKNKDAWQYVNEDIKNYFKKNPNIVNQVNELKKVVDKKHDKLKPEDNNKLDKRDDQGSEEILF